MKDATSWWEKNHRGSWKRPHERWADVQEESSAKAVLQKIGMEHSDTKEEEKEEDQLWFGQDFRTEEQKACDADGTGAKPFCGRWPKRSGGSEGEVEQITSEETPKEAPGILYPEGVKPIAQVDAEFKEYRKENPVIKDDESVQFVPALIKLAIPESTSEANRDLD